MLRVFRSDVAPRRIGAARDPHHNVVAVASQSNDDCWGADHSFRHFVETHSGDAVGRSCDHCRRSALRQLYQENAKEVSGLGEKESQFFLL